MHMKSYSVVETASVLREILGPVSDRAKNKTRDKLCEIDRLWLSFSPFCLMSTSDENGMCDVSPKGDPPGFTLVLDERTIVIPERIGNRRADSFHNIIRNGHVGLLYIIPGRGDTLRINGSAKLVSDAPFFENLIVKGHRPSLALVVDIKEVFFHCSKAFLRSALWEPGSWNADSVPSRPHIAKEAEKNKDTIEVLEEYYGENYRKGLY